MPAPPVLIIIVTFNKKDYVVNLLESLGELDYDNCDVVVVDNASIDGTADSIRESFPHVKVIENAENTGGSGGFNTGLSYAFGQDGYKYYYLLDNDVVVSKNSLSELVKVLESDEGIAVAGSQMCQLDNPEVTNEVGAYVDLNYGGLVLNRHLTRKSNNRSGIYDVDYVAAASLVVRADVARKAGLWEDFFIHFDDVEWCLRIKGLGYRIAAVADSVIWHLSAAEKPVTWQQYYDVRNMLFLLKKYASLSDVRRFLVRKCLQAVEIELRGLSPMAEMLLYAVEDFKNDRRGGRNFDLPRGYSEDDIKSTHPDSGVLVVQSEWFDVQGFPFDSGYERTIKDLIIPPYLVDALWYWKRNGRIIPRMNRATPKKFLMMVLGLAGYRKYERAYVDIRYMPYFASLLARELVVKIDDTYWLLDRRPLSVYRSVMRRGLKAFKNICLSFFIK
ncbi:galactofuranosyl transferase GlfT2 [bacterium BMS3Abin08]|nr:galactofuranosyl transferase GlfT2 [bacterium BMS3Abin08]